LEQLEAKLGIRYRNHLEQQAAHFINTGLLHFEDNCLKATHKGAFVADGIAADLFLIDLLEKVQ
jgi:oxygen-independent coproporphyrinogen-3 oxidase